MDYYELLGVSKEASDAQIKAAYRTQALKWHPDRNKSPEAAEKFKKITHAFEILSDPKKRQLYDQYGSAAFERGGVGSEGADYYQQGPFKVYTNFGQTESPFGDFDFGGFSDPFEIFEQFFGFQSPFSRGRRPARRPIYEMNLSFEEAVRGVEKETVIGGKTKRIKIPAGVDSDTQIRFSEFDVLVKISPHPYFKREGQDIYLEKEISFPRAVLGGTVSVPTIDGSVDLRVRSATKSGTTLRLRGRGVPYPNLARRGYQYVTFKVHVPDRVSARLRKLLEELEKELS